MYVRETEKREMGSETGREDRVCYGCVCVRERREIKKREILKVQ